MALFGALALVIFVLVRPMEIWPELAQLMPLELLAVFTALALGWESFTKGRTRSSSPQLIWLFAFLLWCFAATLAKLGADTGLSVMRTVSLGPLFMLLVMFEIGRAHV